MVAGDLLKYLQYLFPTDEFYINELERKLYTLSQQEEIISLKKELEEKKKQRDESVKSIIGYFFKSR